MLGEGMEQEMPRAARPRAAMGEEYSCLERAPEAGAPRRIYLDNARGGDRTPTGREPLRNTPPISERGSLSGLLHHPTTFANSFHLLSKVRAGVNSPTLTPTTVTT